MFFMAAKIQILNHKITVKSFLTISFFEVLLKMILLIVSLLLLQSSKSNQTAHSSLHASSLGLTIWLLPKTPNA